MTRPVFRPFSAAPKTAMPVAAAVCACIAIAVQVFPRGSSARGEENQAATLAADAVGDLPNQTRAAGGAFAPHTEDDLAAARRSLSSAISQLDRYLNTGGANGRNWKRYLLWDEMQRQLSSPMPDSTELERVYRRYVADHAGLEQPVWRHVAEALRAYLDLAAELADLKAKAAYEAQLTELADCLEAFAEAGAGRIGTLQLCRWAGSRHGVRPCPWYKAFAAGSRSPIYMST